MHLGLLIRALGWGTKDFQFMHLVLSIDALGWGTKGYQIMHLGLSIHARAWGTCINVNPCTRLGHPRTLLPLCRPCQYTLEGHRSEGAVQLCTEEKVVKGYAVPP